VKPGSEPQIRSLPGDCYSYSHLSVSWPPHRCRPANPEKQESVAGSGVSARSTDSSNRWRLLRSLMTPRLATLMSLCKNAKSTGLAKAADATVPGGPGCSASRSPGAHVPLSDPNPPVWRLLVAGWSGRRWYGRRAGWNQLRRVQADSEERRGQSHDALRVVRPCPHRSQYRAGDCVRPGWLRTASERVWVFPLAMSTRSAPSP
jgi:hypothetical protein